MATTEEAQKLYLDAIHRRAMEVVAAPKDERPARYETIRGAYYQSARELGQSEELAREAGAKMVEFTEALVRIMEMSGGGEAGKA